MTMKYKDVIDMFTYLENSSCEEFRLNLEGNSFYFRRRQNKDLDVTRQKNDLGQIYKEDNKIKKIISDIEIINNDERRHSSISQNPNLDEVIVVAPMNGVFYRKPSPDEDNFVEIGDSVSEGEPLCVIEVMKLFSTLYAPCNGRIVKIHIENEDSISEGEPLITISTET